MIEQTQQDHAVASDASDATEFRKLDPRVIGLWRATNLVAFAIILIATVLGLTIASIAKPWLWLWGALPVALVLFLGVWFGYVRPARLYRSWGYRIDEKVLETRSGLIFQVARLLPLSRLQHVDLHRGPLERAFGLASLILHTAGTTEASIKIPGLDASEAARLRDRLVEIGGDDAV